MAENTDPKTDPADDGGAEAEKHFWEEHKSRTRAVLDEWFEEKRKAATSRTSGGRTTLPKILADLVFGPEK